jgi:hypothetical protein
MPLKLLYWAQQAIRLSGELLHFGAAAGDGLTKELGLIPQFFHAFA